VRRRRAGAGRFWVGGGDLWDFESYGRGTPIDSLINDGLYQRNIVIGGTSAGMAILGRYYFSAMNGTVTSGTALANPYSSQVTVDGTPFLTVDYMADVITDTHYDNPDRRGRQVTFMARVLTDFGQAIKGIACDEYTAVCIDTGGIAHVYGDYPNNDDNAYFLQVNCEVPNNLPEVCQPNQPLQWDQGGNAIKVYVVKGTPTGVHTLDLRDWETGSGGAWEHWSVYNSVLFASPAAAINCGATAVAPPLQADALQAFPNPSAGGMVQIVVPVGAWEQINLCNALGQSVWHMQTAPGQTRYTADLGALPAGIYWLQATEADRRIGTPLILKGF
jgi:hypothetical protein